MYYENRLNESIEIINELLECINWLGGDAYEVECTDDMTRNAYKFLEQFKDKEDSAIKETHGITEIKLCHSEGVYKMRDNDDKWVVAHNKKHAANLLRTQPKKTVCVIQFSDVYLDKKKKHSYKGIPIII
jgi:hypothetical protein